MSQIIDQIDRVIEVDAGEIESGGRKAAVSAQYIPPLDGRDDSLYAAFDMRVAEGIGRLLNKHYFGYEWKSYADTKQGVVGFSIPELMGPTLHMVINLKKWDALTLDQIVIDKAGELLERMWLPRDKGGMEAILEAKQRRHSFDFSGPNGKRLQ